MVSARPIKWILTACLLLAACQNNASLSPTPEPASEAPTLPAAATSAPEYIMRLRNADYQLGLTDAPRIVTLAEGKFEQGTAGAADYLSVSMTELTARGDLNNDGVDEYAVLVAENYGGSGVFVFLAVFTDTAGGLKFLTSALVDDRPQLNKLYIEEGQIFLDATIHKKDEPMCCPTLHTARHYQLINNQLDTTDFTTFTPDERPRTISIEAPANGTEAFGSIRIKGIVAIAPFENNLVYRIYDLGGVELAIGSITVNATELGGPGTFDAEILLGKALSGALIRIEVQDLSAEDGSLLSMDSVELVVR